MFGLVFIEQKYFMCNKCVVHCGLKLVYTEFLNFIAGGSVHACIMLAKFGASDKLRTTSLIST